MNVWKTRHYTSEHGGQPTANSKSLFQRRHKKSQKYIHRPFCWSGTELAERQINDVRIHHVTDRHVTCTRRGRRHIVDVRSASSELQFVSTEIRRVWRWDAWGNGRDATSRVRHTNTSLSMTRQPAETRYAGPVSMLLLLLLLMLQWLYIRHQVMRSVGDSILPRQNVQPFNAHIKTAQQRRPTIIHQYGYWYAVGVDGWAVTFGTARRGLGGLQPRPVPPHYSKCNSPPINGQCTNSYYLMWHYNCLWMLKG